MKLKKEVIAKFIEQNIKKPHTVKSLLRLMTLDKSDRLQFKNVLKQLVRDGRLVRVKGNRFVPPRESDVITGRWDPARNGSFGFIIPDDKSLPEIFVRNVHIKEPVLPGDKVVGRIDGYKDGGRAFGRIINITEQKVLKLIGRFIKRDTYSVVIPFDTRIVNEVYVLDDYDMEAASDEYVEVEITTRVSRSGMMQGKVSRVIGNIDIPGIDREIIVTHYGIRNKFSQEIKDATNKIEMNTTNYDDSPDRVNYCNSMLITIDGEDARDFDDAVYLEKSSSGWILSVHIADVSEFVLPGTLLDTEAYSRSCSVYFPETAIPMLPETISNGICSLKPYEERLTISCVIEFDKFAEPVTARFEKSVIKSAARLTYNKVQEALSGKEHDLSEKMVSMLKDMRFLSQKLRKRRFARGSIDFNFPELVLEMDDENRVTGITKRVSTESHQIIEEFMIAANEAAAQFLSYYHSPALFRVHDLPDNLKLVKFFDIYKTLGYKPPEDMSEIKPRMLAKAITRIKGTVHEQALSTLLLRSLKLAIYSPSNTGHFALASDDYTHFTSPIRRYPDLLVHRSIKNLIDMGITKIDQDNVKPLSKKNLLELNKISAHCSFTERNAERAERELTKWRQLRYLKEQMGEVYKALIIDVRTHGLNIEIVDYYLTGNIHIADLYDDYYHYDERRRIFVGEKTHKTYKIGQNIEVLISKIDIHARKVDFSPVGLDIRRKRKKSNRKSGRRFH